MQAHDGTYTQRPTNSNRPTVTNPQKPTHSDWPTAAYPERPSHSNRPTAITPQQLLTTTDSWQPTHSNRPAKKPLRPIHRDQPTATGSIHRNLHTKETHMGCSVQGIISNILQRMNSASSSTISAPVYQGDGTCVILARVFHGGEIFDQARDTSYLGTGCFKEKGG